MKNVSLRLNVAETKKQFAPLFSVINRSTVLPILEDIRVVQNGSLKFSATDLENLVTLTKPSQSKDEFDFFIDAGKVKPFFQNNISDEFSITGNEEKVNIENGGFKVSTSLDKSDNYPKPAEFEEGVSEKINSKELCALFEKAIPFLSQDDLRPAITGINLFDWNGKLFVVTTDAHRLFYKSAMETPKNFKGISVIIPNKSARLFVQMFKDEEVEIKISKYNIFFIGKDKELVSRLIDTKYPDFIQVLITGEYKFSLQRKQLNAFVKIAERFTNSTTHQTILDVDNECISFSGGEYDMGEFSYKLPIYNTNKEIKKFDFSVNINFLKDALSVNKKDEYVYFEHTGSSTKGFQIDDCVLIMPLMLNRY